MTAERTAQDLLAEFGNTFGDDERKLTIEEAQVVHKLVAVAEAAQELDHCEDFGTPLSPGQDPTDWDAYNAIRRKVYDALSALRASLEEK